MDFEYSERTMKLRREVEEFMDAHIYPNEDLYYEQLNEGESRWETPPILEELKAKAKSAGLWNMFLPESERGAGLTNMEYTPLCEIMGKVHFAGEVFNCSAPDTGNMETIERYGTEEHKKQWLEPLLNGEIRSAFAMTEPAVASSDAMNIESRIERDGDEYVVNGSKIWTTLGNYADHMILLARTNPNTERKYDGLSFFLSPMKIDGVEAHPIRKVTGEYGFNQTFFTDAKIPASCLMGEEGGGWMVAMKTLEYERGVTAGQASGYWGVTIQVDDMIEELSKLEHDGEPLLSDPVVRNDLVGFIMEAKALSLTGRRSGIPALTSDYPMGLALSVKYRGTEYERRMKQYTASKQGALSALYVGDADAVSGGFWQRAYFSNFGATIGGGTTQVQANIVAEHVLGLPK